MSDLEMSDLEIAAALTSLITIWLTARRHILCWPLGLVASALYGKVFFDSRLYSDMLLQGLFGVFILYGWLMWWRGARMADGRIVVEPLPRRGLVAGLAAGALGAVVLGFLMSRYTNAAVPWLDATLSSFSLVGQFWTARRHIANWQLWVVVDIVYVGLFIVKDLYLTAGLYAVLMVLAIIGWRTWARAARLQQAAEQGPFFA